MELLPAPLIVLDRTEGAASQPEAVSRSDIADSRSNASVPRFDTAVSRSGIVDSRFEDSVARSEVAASRPDTAFARSSVSIPQSDAAVSRGNFAIARPDAADPRSYVFVVTRSAISDSRSEIAMPNAQSTGASPLNVAHFDPPVSFAEHASISRSELPTAQSELQSVPQAENLVFRSGATGFEVSVSRCESGVSRSEAGVSYTEIAATQAASETDTAMSNADGSSSEIGVSQSPEVTVSQRAFGVPGRTEPSSIASSKSQQQIAPQGWRYDINEKNGFAKLQGMIGERKFECVLQTLLCVIGRETGVEQATERQFSGYHCHEVMKTDFVCVNIFRPSGLQPFSITAWHPFDLTRIGFGSFKKLSRTHFSISWNSHQKLWTIVCLSGNGVTINDRTKLKESEETRLNPGDSVGAANNTVKLVFYPAN